jgi:transposase
LAPAKALVADKGYDSWPFVALVAETGGCAHIPTRRHVKAKRFVAPDLYRERNRIERFFCKLKQFRRAATRFDKLGRNFLATLILASLRIWLRHVESTP